MKLLVLTSALLTFAFTNSARADEKPIKAEIKVSNERVQKLFDTMRAGKYERFEFPELKWDDIPALLEMGSSERLLKSFPRNFLSSQAEQECPEGMAALWLIEGLRKGGKDYPSLNALCLLKGDKDGTWTVQSARNQERVLKAYQEWWKQVKTLPADKAAAMDPLHGTNLRWY